MSSRRRGRDLDAPTTNVSQTRRVGDVVVDLDGGNVFLPQDFTTELTFLFDAQFRNTIADRLSYDVMRSLARILQLAPADGIPPMYEFGKVATWDEVRDDIIAMRHITTIIVVSDKMGAFLLRTSAKRRAGVDSSDGMVMHATHVFDPSLRSKPLSDKQGKGGIARRVNVNGENAVEVVYEQHHVDTSIWREEQIATLSEERRMALEGLCCASRAYELALDIEPTTIQRSMTFMQCLLRVYLKGVLAPPVQSTSQNEWPHVAAQDWAACKVDMPCAEHQPVVRVIDILAAGVRSGVLPNPLRVPMRTRSEFYMEGALVEYITNDDAVIPCGSVPTPRECLLVGADRRDGAQRQAYIANATANAHADTMGVMRLATGQLVAVWGRCHSTADAAIDVMAVWTLGADAALQLRCVGACIETRMTHTHLAALALCIKDPVRYGRVDVCRDALGNTLGDSPFGGTWRVPLANAKPKPEWKGVGGAKHVTMLAGYCKDKCILTRRLCNY